MKWLAIVAAVAILNAQTAPPPDSAAKPDAAQKEQLELSKAISEAGQSGIDYIRALERHLAKYPESVHRAEIEKALAKSAMDGNDRARVVKYGQHVLDADRQSDDLQLYDAVIRGLLDTDDKDSATRALIYIKRYEKQLEAMRPRAAEGHMSESAWSAQVDKGMARALVLDARATGNTGDGDRALNLARSAWAVSPNAESAREIARWLVKLDRKAEAIEYYADSFAMDDERTTEADRARDRARLGEIYTALNGSEKGLGDAILEAYDRTVAVKKARLASDKLKDPNAGATEISDFTLPSGTGGQSLALSSLKGKTVVLDFWATWCGPCKVQHPMIDEIRKRYADSANVVFVSVDSDADRALVEPFIKEMHWTGPFYYDGGIGHVLNISSIPTVIVLDRNGRISSRMVGFIPERFEDMLTERIEETRAN